VMRQEPSILSRFTSGVSTRPPRREEAPPTIRRSLVSVRGRLLRV